MHNLSTFGGPVGYCGGISGREGPRKRDGIILSNHTIPSNKGT